MGVIQSNTTPIIPKLIASDHEVQVAWSWFIQNINHRPTLQPKEKFIFDNKKWGNLQEVSKNPDEIRHLAILYLKSQLSGDPSDLIQISRGVYKGIRIFTPGIEPAIKKLVEGEDSFRFALSEHLAFWIQVVTLTQQGRSPQFIVSLPNALPRDPGPDGLSLVIDRNQTEIIEIRSVKSAIGDPSSHIASANFRKGGEAEPTKQLEEFFLICTKGYGFNKFDRLLTTAFHAMGRSTEDEYRASLIQSQSILNAVVVANTHYSKADIFAAYDRVPRLAQERIATYIGVGNWEVLSKDVQEQVLKLLDSAGVR